MRALRLAAFLAVVADVTAAASAEEIAPGPGADIVAADCNACHSLDYIRTNAPFMTGKIWEAEVAKMINVFGASIEPADAKTIVDYLTRNYGKPG